MTCFNNLRVFLGERQSQISHYPNLTTYVKKERTAFSFPLRRSHMIPSRYNRVIRQLTSEDIHQIEQQLRL
ncbi:hypothetical protein [Loigolactobacillus backii]|uniref:hypothetical protein n=1 Tax=Loigolactobacillus backii TaxID=375175 RepID=UPI00117AE30E|nr:hypothetical protein [Loigolactobacillus backii]